MMTPHPIPEALQSFSGLAPLFPLPNASCLPHALTPLHVFEPRYRQMTADALEGEKLIAMALLRPGWELLPEDAAPPICEMTCLGKIVAAKQLSDGRYYLLLQGLARCKVSREHEPQALPYRVAYLDICPDQYAKIPVIDRNHRAQELLKTFDQLYPDIDLSRMLGASCDVSLPLGIICDVLAHALRLDVDASYEILAEADVDLRSELVLQRLRAKCRGLREPTGQRKFPPEFSLN